eukprot:CFRG1817T1
MLASNAAVPPANTTPKVTKLSLLTLRVRIVDSGAVRSMQFDPSMILYDVCKEILDKLGQRTNLGLDHGLFKPADDYSRGIWLNAGRTLEYYDLKSGDLVEYKKKHRPLKVVLMDESQRTVLIDDSQNVGQIIKVICSRINLSNPDEFSLTIDEAFKDARPEGGIYEDSKKEKEAKRRDEKRMARLEEKLNIKDEWEWLNHEKTLREQGAGENDAVRLRKKFFFSDQNVDRNDPVQLNLMYVQARDDILKSAHPCNADEAVQFAALQCQCQLGDHNPETHKPGSVDLKIYLPKGNTDMKHAERRILAEHRKLKGMTELNAKYRYIQLCRSLKTYGMSFFLVKEKVKSKNKLVPRLLGVSRDSIMRVDERTKEVIKTWPLSTVRRWAASPTSFTLDFGDYSDEYYSVQTTEGEHISRLIAGYIDFILKKKKESEFRPIDDEGTGVTFTDNIAAGQGSAIQYLGSAIGRATDTNVGRVGVVKGTRNGVASVSRNGFQRSITSRRSSDRLRLKDVAENDSEMALIKAEDEFFVARANLEGQLTSGHATVNACSSDLQTATSLPPLGTDAGSILWKKQTLEVNAVNTAAQLASLSATTANIMMLTSEPKDKQNLLATGSAVVSAAGNLAEMTKGMKLLAALVDDEEERESLLACARNLADATSKLFQAVNPDSEMERKDLLATANAVGLNVQELLRLIPGDLDVDPKACADLCELAKDISSMSAHLINSSKAVANKSNDPVSQSKVIESAKATAINASQLAAATRVLSPTINHMQCQEALAAAARRLLNAVNGLNASCKDATQDGNLVGEVDENAVKVKEGIAALVKRVKYAGEAMEKEVTYDAKANEMSARVEELDVNDADQVAALVLDIGDIIDIINLDANEEDDENRKSLLDLAKNLRDACKGLGGNTVQHELLKSLTAQAAQDAHKRKVLRDLELAVKKTAQVSLQLIAASTNAAATNRNAASQKQLMEQARTVSDTLSKMIPITKSFSQDRMNPENQLALINESDGLMAPGSKLVATAKVATATVGDKAAAKQLTNFSRACAVALTELRDAHAAASEACGSLEIAAAIQTIASLEDELDEAVNKAENGTMVKANKDDLEPATLEVAAIIRSVGASMAQVLSAATQGNSNYSGIAARDTANALQIMAASAQTVAAAQPDNKAEILAATAAVMAPSAQLMRDAQWALETPVAEDKQERLQDAARGVQQALKNVLNTLPGQKGLNEAIQAVRMVQARLAEGQLNGFSADNSSKTGEETSEQLRKRMDKACADLTAATSALCNARGSPKQLADASGKYAKCVHDVVGAGESVLCESADLTDTHKAELVEMLMAVTANCASMLVCAKQASASPQDQASRANLLNASRQVQAALNNLLSQTASSSPGVADTTSASLKVKDLLKNLQDDESVGLEPTAASMTYFDCLVTAGEKARSISKAADDISNSSIAKDCETLGINSKSMADDVSDLIEAANQAAYLVAVADSASTPAEIGCIDNSQIATSHKAIRESCETLQAGDSDQKDVLAAVTLIAKHTSSLCAACKVASAKTTNPIAKQNFISLAKGIAITTGALVKDIKVLAAEPSEENRVKVGEGIKPLLHTVEQLESLSASPEFATVPATIAPQARAKQEPILTGGICVAQTSDNLLDSVRMVVESNIMDGNTDDTKLTSQSKGLNSALNKLLAALNDNAPGRKECEDAIETLKQVNNDLSQALLACSLGSLKPRQDNDLQGFNEGMLSTCQDINNSMDTVVSACKGEPQKLGMCVSEFAELFLPLVSSAAGAASKLAKRNKQQDLLEQSKVVTSSALTLALAARDAGGDRRDAKAHAAVDNAAVQFQLDISSFMRMLEAETGDAGAMSAIIANLQRSIQILSLPANTIHEDDDDDTDDERVSLSALIMDMQHGTKHVASTLPGILSVPPQELKVPMRTLAAAFNELSTITKTVLENARSTESTGGHEDANVLSANVTELGTSLVGLVTIGKNLQANNTDYEARQQLVGATTVVSDNVGRVFSALQSSSRGFRACENAIDTIQGVNAELTTTAMFARAGALNHENPGDNFEQYKAVVKSANTRIVDAAKHMIMSAGGSQEQLGDAANECLSAFQDVALQSKNAAQAVGARDKGAQELMLNGASDLGKSLMRLISATVQAVGKNPSDPAVDELKSESKEMVSAATAYMKIIQSVDDEAMRGVRATECAADAIKLEVPVLDNNDPNDCKKIGATPENMASATRGVTIATANLVSATYSGNQNDLMSAANSTRKSVVELIHTGKGAVNAANDASENEKKDALDSLRNITNASLNLLNAVNACLVNPTDENKAKLPALSHNVAAGVSVVCDAAQALKGDDMVDPDDPHIIAEQELLAAAAQIEAAAQKLAELRPRQREYEVNANMTFEEMIVTAAQGIASATSALMIAAQGAQKELYSQGRLHNVKGTGKYHDDITWSEGLVSAAKNVAGSTELLCEAANQVVTGSATEEKLISSSMAVSRSTQQLLIACRVKADKHSKAMDRLDNAGGAVRKATNALVASAKEAAVFQEEKAEIEINNLKVGSIAQEIAMQEAILKKEKELENARKQLTTLRKQKYAKS